jgi:C-terminal processing protease CtpA/Prc
MNKTKSIKGLFSLVQPTDKNDADAMNLNNNQVNSPNTSVHSMAGSFDENCLKIDFSKIFKTTLQKNSNNELGFTVTKLPNGYSCIKEILHEPALLNRSIQTGDIIISVNKSATKSLSHRDVVTYLRVAGSIVELELYRPDAEIILPYLNQRKHKQTHYAKSLNSPSKEIKENIAENNEKEIDCKQKYGDIEADELDQVVSANNEVKNKKDSKLIEKRVSLIHDNFRK